MVPTEGLRCPETGKEGARLTKEQRDGIEAAVVAGIGIMGIVLIVLYGLYCGHDGSLMALGVGAIGVIVGGIGHFGFTKLLGK